MSIGIVVVLTLLYSVFMGYLMIKLIDIFKNNEKYNHIKDWDSYRRSFWFEHPSEYWKNGIRSKNYWAPILVGIPINGVILGAYYGVSVGIQQYLLAPKNALIVFRTDDYWWGMLGFLFFTIFLSFWICFNSKIPICIASTIGVFNFKSRGSDWKKLILALTLISFITLPFSILAIDNYGYVTSEKISYNAFFSLREQEYSLNDIQEVTTSLSFDDQKKKFHLSYQITIGENMTFDVAKAGIPATALVNNLLKSKTIAFHKAVIDRATDQKLEEICKPATMELIHDCFICSET